MRGKGQCTFTVCSNLWDHPRLCGEKCPAAPLEWRGLGSPPPMRGKVDVVKNAAGCFLGSPPPMRGKEPPRGEK